MRLETALFTSKEGLNVHGQAIGVIGDNISNVNTVGFRTSRTEFSDLIADGIGTLQGSSVTGGGNGVQVARIRQIHDTGVIEFTGRSLDVAIEGSGFFVIGNGDDRYYTRAGNFEMNEEGFLVDAKGQQVYGVPASSGSSSTLAPLNLTDIDTSGSETTEASLIGNLNAAEQVKTVVTNPANFTELTSGATTTNAFTINDSLGQEHSINIIYFKTDANTWTAQAYADGAETGGVAGQPVLLGQATLVFGADGSMSDADKANAKMTISPAYSNGSAAQNINVDLSGFTQYATSNVLNGVTQNGQGTGEVTGYEFKKDGRLVAKLSSGSEILVGTLNLANVARPDGLQRAGNNTFIASNVEGGIISSQPGKNGIGTLAGSSLERSTVDLANQFVDLTLYQRGYQANSQVLNAASGMIRDTLGLIR